MRIWTVAVLCSISLVSAFSSLPHANNNVHKIGFINRNQSYSGRSRNRKVDVNMNWFSGITGEKEESLTTSESAVGEIKILDHIGKAKKRTP